MKKGLLLSMSSLTAGLILLAGCSTPAPTPEKPITQPVPSQQTNVIMRVQGGEMEPQSFEVECKSGKAEGTHPNPEGACEVLLNADVALFSSDQTGEECTDVYGGDNLVLMVGHIKGKPISTEFSRTDGCEIARWNTLVPLLPQANDEIIDYEAPGGEN